MDGQLRQGGFQCQMGKREINLLDVGYLSRSRMSLIQASVGFGRSSMKLNQSELVQPHDKLQTANFF